MSRFGWFVLAGAVALCGCRPPESEPAASGGTPDASHRSVRGAQRAGLRAGDRAHVQQAGRVVRLPALRGRSIVARARVILDPLGASGRRANLGSLSLADPSRAAQIAAIQRSAGPAYRVRRERGTSRQLLENPAQQLAARVSAAALELESSAGEAWSLTLESVDYGRRTSRYPLVAGAPTVAQNRLAFARDHRLSEWYLNGSLGIEHGFTLSVPPPGKRSDISIRLRLGGSLTPSLDGPRVLFRAADGSAVAAYRELHARDADGRSLPARMKLRGRELELVVDDRAARYPVEIDPLLTTETKVVMKNPGSFSQLGRSVDISGDTAVVGAPGHITTAGATGAVFVFTRSGSSWSLQQKIVSTSAKADDLFGQDVAISGTTIVIGAPGAGAAYVYVRSGSSWSRQAVLTGSDAKSGDELGGEVAIDKDTVVVGARKHDGTKTDSGAAYVFVRSASSWTQQGKLTASDAAAGDLFGTSVTVAADTIVCGANRKDGTGSNEGAAYVFVRASGSWTQQAKLTASDAEAGGWFGGFVSLSGSSVLIGSNGADAKGRDSGAAYVFLRSGTSWSQQAKLVAADGAAYDSFGSAVAIEGDRAVVGAKFNDDGGATTGSVYVFARSGSSWTQEKKLDASDAKKIDYLGWDVALSKSSVLAGAPGVDDEGERSGAAYVFVRSSGPTWTQQEKLLIPGVTDAQAFGRSVAVEKTTLLAGAPADEGSAFAFDKSGSSWVQQQEIEPSSLDSSDLFGYHLAMSGKTAVISAQNDDDKGTNAGAAYVFVRGATKWTLQQKLVASDGSGGDYLGAAVSISGDTIALGAYGDDDHGSSSGSVYIFERSGTSWSQRAKLTASNGKASDLFGYTVAVSGTSVLVGAPGRDDAGSYSGTAYVFTESGGSWTQQQQLTASDAAASDFFGGALALEGDTALIGAARKQSYRGAAYVFTRSGTTWSQKARLLASNGASQHEFGAALALSGSLALIGAPSYDGASTNMGAAYFFALQSGTWSEALKVTASDAGSADAFGTSVAIDGAVAAVGTHRASGKLNAVYVYELGWSNGSPCSTAALCDSGYCVDGVCCKSACGGGKDDCQACSKRAGASTDGTCEVASKGTVCRASKGPCDAVERCDGIAGLCPADLFATPGTPCPGGFCAGGACVAPDAGGARGDGPAPAADSGGDSAGPDVGPQRDAGGVPDAADAAPDVQLSIDAGLDLEQRDTAAADGGARRDGGGDAGRRDAGRDARAPDAARGQQVDGAAGRGDAGAGDQQGKPSGGCDCDLDARGGGLDPWASMLWLAGLVVLRRRNRRQARSKRRGRSQPDSGALDERLQPRS